ncbi:MAG TPA: DNA (cytosine-5-)-methyltransferase [bacterium]|nr:DNA (cytosine-5-)-methyltransferase [bacterium]
MKKKIVKKSKTRKKTYTTYCSSYGKVAEEHSGFGNREAVYLNYGELFCGPGGLAYGALRACAHNEEETYRLRHVWASDFDEDACETYRHNICPDSPKSVITKDVRFLNISKLEEIEAFAFGFPCNDFSLVGDKKGINGKYGPLYNYGIKVIDCLKPKFFIAENVSGIVSANNGSAFKTIVRDLKSSGGGYKLTAHLYKAEEYGIPQTRHRIIIVGIHESLGLSFQVPAPTTLGKHITAREALEIPPIPSTAMNQDRTTQSKTVVERLKHIQPGDNVWNSNMPEHLRLNVKGARISQIYRRLHPDKPSYTITGSGGGGTHCYHWLEPRALTNRERARLQTFPDGYEFKGSKESVRKQIGMAVPPKLSEIITTAVLKTFAGVKYNSISANMSFEETNLELSFGGL